MIKELGEQFERVLFEQVYQSKRLIIGLTSAGTLNFSTTPSSKNMRMPALMRSNSVTGKSLKENRYRFSPLTLSATGMFALWTETHDMRGLFPEMLKVSFLWTNFILVQTKWNDWLMSSSPTVCTSLSGRSLQDQHQTSPWCSGCKRENKHFSWHLHCMLCYTFRDFRQVLPEVPL